MKTSHLFACVTACALAVSQACANLIVNGDFQSGNTGFGSDYVYGQIGLTDTSYSVVNDPFGPADFQNPYIGSGYFDHTYGTAAQGLMMAVNGGTDSGKKVWSQTVNGLTIGQQYNFSFWLSSWYSANIASLNVEIDGVLQGTFGAPSTTAEWQQHSFLWTASSTSAGFTAFYDTVTAPNGNDFAIDDISLVAVPEPATMIAGALLLLPFGVSTLRILRKHRAA